MSEKNIRKCLAKAESGVSGLQNALATSNSRLISKYRDELHKTVDDLVELSIDLEDEEADDAESRQTLSSKVQETEKKSLNLIFQADEHISAKEERDILTSKDKVKSTILSELKSELGAFSVALSDEPKTILEDTAAENVKGFLNNITARKVNSFAELKAKKSKLLENYQCADEEVKALAALFIEAESKLETWLNKAAALDKVQVAPQEPKPHSPEVKIDRLALPVFDGSARNFSRFLNAFNNTVGVAYHDPAVKLLYLKGQCLKSEPKQLIQSVTDYDVALARLKQKYGRADLVISEILKDIDGLKLDDNEAKAIVKLSSVIESVVDDAKAVQAYDDLCNIVTLGSIEAKLPERILIKWVEKKVSLTESTTKQNVKHLLEFLNQEARFAESLLTVQVKSKKTPDLKFRPKNFNGNIQKNSDEPKECYRCGGQNHTAKTCRVPREVVCRYCKGRGHIEKACFKKKKETKSNEHNPKALDKVDTSKSSSTNKDDQSKHVKFTPENTVDPTSNVANVLNASSSDVNVRLPFDILNTNVGTLNALWDSGSMLNFIDSEFAEAKNMKGKDVQLSYRMVNGEICHSQTKVYQIVLLSKTGKKRHINAYGITPIMQNIPTVELDHLASQYKVIEAKLSKIAIPEGNVHLLIGADSLTEFPTRAWSKNNIMLMNSKFGVNDFLICGSDALFSHTASVGHVAAIDVKQISMTPVCEKIVGHVESIRRESMLKDFWSVEDMGVKPPTLCNACLNCRNCNENVMRLSDKDARDYEIIRKNLSFNPHDHQWEATYPFTTNPVILRDNYQEAHQALIRCETRLSKDEKLKQSYLQQINDFQSRGVIRKLSNDEMQCWDGPVRYVSHHEVHKESATTPLRLVVNSSFKKGLERSLNDILLKGPNVLSDMFSVLLRWRFFNIAFIGDISKMYHNIRTGDLEGHLRRMLWRDFDVKRSPDVYVFQRVTFGDRPAGCLAVIALQQTADMFSAISPEAARILKQDSYMDDIVSGSDSVENAHELISDIKAIASQGGFTFKEFVMSGNSVQSQGSSDHKLERVLGHLWSPSDDTLMFNVSLNPNKKVKGERKPPDKSLKETNLTKRICLRMINSIFDPFGILVPLTVLLKIKMKEYFVLQENDIKWDSLLADVIQEDFKKIFLDLMSLFEFKVPRSVATTLSPDVAPILLCFTDASKQAFCAAVYIRVSIGDNVFQTRLLVSKTRVSPVKQESIPRLELLGVLLGVRLIVKIKKAISMELNEVMLLTDSKCVLGMINNSKTPLNGFVGSRVHEIRAQLNEIQFAWVPSQNNIADLGSRGGNLSSFSDESEWLFGPHWLKLPQEDWPIEHTPNDVETEPNDCVFSIVSNDTQPLIKAKDYSDLSRLLKVTAYCIYFFRSKGNHKSSIDTDWTKITLSADSFIAAEEYWVKIVSENVVQSIDNLTSLRPKIVYDDKGKVLRVVTSGRLGKMLKIGYDASELTILDPQHPFTKLVLKQYHEEKHASDDYVLWRSRTKYWVPNARRVIRSIRNKCYLCRILSKKCQSQQMSTLPDCRLLPCPPFTYVALDLFGPLQHSDLVKKRLTSKCWGVVITCLTCRAVHLDLSPSYDTDSLLQVLRRFFSIRGIPTKIISDQGTQLIAASKEVEGMLELLDWSSVKGWTAKHKVEWEFVPIRGQHVNGCAEAIVKSTKKLLTPILESKRLTFTEIQTVLLEIAQILNSRPLGLYNKPGTDPLDGGPITPNHLLLGRANNATPFLKYEQNVSLTKRIRFLNSIIEEFWSKFKISVYPSLMPTYKWKKEKRLARVGDVVLLDTEDSKVGQYKLGRVIGIKLNADNLPRTLTIEYVTTDGQGDITKRTTSRSIHNCVLIVPIEEQN